MSSSCTLLEELARAGALDDAVVVGAGQRDRLADAELGERLGAGALERGRVLERAGADDAALRPSSGAARSARCRCRPGW